MNKVAYCKWSLVYLVEPEKHFSSRILSIDFNDTAISVKDRSNLEARRYPNVCPICRRDVELDEFCFWVISPPFSSLLLHTSMRLFMELNCCTACRRGIRNRQLLTYILIAAIPLQLVGLSLLLWFYFPDVSFALTGIAVVSIAYGTIQAAYRITGLNAIRVKDQGLLERANGLSRRILRNATPWLSLSLLAINAERVDPIDDEANEI